MCLTTSLTGGLETSGAHFLKLLLWQKYRWLYRHLCLEFTEPMREHLYKEHTQTIRVLPYTCLIYGIIHKLLNTPLTFSWAL